jgi:hypothetical protein
MHHGAWLKVLADAFTVNTHFLVARTDDRQICGVLPAYSSNSLFYGKHVASLDDGLLADDASIADALCDTANSIRKQLGASYFLLRAASPDAHHYREVAQRLTVRRIVHTEKPAGLLFQNLSSYVRRDVRRSVKRGYRIIEDHSLAELDRSFYDEYARHMLHLGTPVMSRRMMTAMRQHLGSEKLRLYLALRGDMIVGGLLCVTNQHSWTALYGIVRQEMVGYYATCLLYWHAISEVARAGIKRFDLGRNSPGGGVMKFKAKWPGEDREIRQVYFAESVSRIPNFNELLQGRSFKQRVWMRLPLPFANRVGPWLRRDLPFG